MVKYIQFNYINKELQKKYLSIIGFIIIIIFYSVFISISDFEKFLQQIDSVKIELIPLILGFHFLVVILRIFRQKILFDSIEVQLSLKEHFLIHLTGLALIMTPGGLGQSIKAIYLKEKNNIPYGKSISLTLSERFYDLLSVIPVIFVMSFFVDSFEARLSSILVSILLVIMLIISRNKRIFNLVISKLPKIWIFTSIVANSDELFNILRQLTLRKTFTLSFLIGIGSWLVAGIAFYYSFIAFNLDLTFFETTLISLVPVVIGTLSFLPGGIGAIEITMMGFLSSYGLDNSLSSALILFTRITSIWFLTMIGIIATKIILTKK